MCRVLQICTLGYGVMVHVGAQVPLLYRHVQLTYLVVQEPGRFPEPLAEKMLKWNIDICSREISKTGGTSLDTVDPEKPAATMLNTIDVPVAVSYGTFDETYSIMAMKHVAEKVRGAAVKEFRAAHMVNMEFPDEFNQWLGDWLQEKFLDGE